MSDRLREAAQAVLEAIDLHMRHHESGCVYLDGPYERLLAALAEQDAEPVAYIEHHKGGDNLVWDREKYMKHTTPLYTVPPRREWVSLTDEEIEDLYFDGFSLSKLNEFARAIEAALKDKNEH